MGVAGIWALGTDRGRRRPRDRDLDCGWHSSAVRSRLLPGALLSGRRLSCRSCSPLPLPCWRGETAGALVGRAGGAEQATSPRRRRHATDTTVQTARVTGSRHRRLHRDAADGSNSVGNPRDRRPDGGRDTSGGETAAARYVRRGARGCGLTPRCWRRSRPGSCFARLRRCGGADPAARPLRTWRVPVDAQESSRTVRGRALDACMGRGPPRST